MSKHKYSALLSLTVALLSGGPFLRGDGENDPPRYTEQEWKDKRATELATSNQAELVKLVVAAEVENRSLKNNQVPKGSRVLNDQESKDYAAFLALGKPDEVAAKVKEHGEYAAFGKVADVKKSLDDGAAANAKNADREKAEHIATVAGVAQFKPGVLTDRVNHDKLTDLVVREVEREGKQVKVAYAKDPQGVEHELDAYAKKNWGDYLPALQLTATDTASSGTAFGGQDAASRSSGAGKSWVQEKVDQQQAKGGEGGYKDPLQPAPKS
ncbi:hypothetical protein [Deinococcus sp. Leaf326]|uniref:hypothetical protein n=1 Tax=Deinococcus sp. Leaf326 TaxID=1736338 RepID=UPI0006FDCEE4|nr:hypothetical protein [Deinococcus sp. Leaf326]KQR40756.1 hypothetical protein ASF71_00890 [Deinococcus sp. Leaf326]